MIKYLRILYCAFKLNICGLFNLLVGTKTFIFQMHSLNQYFHVADLISRLNRRYDNKVYLLLPYSESVNINSFKGLPVYPYETTWTLVFYSVVYGLDQRMKYPVFRFRFSKRVCGFHGQPTKGNAFIGVSSRLDSVYLYGSLMKEAWLRDTRASKQLRAIETKEIGQCKTDKYFNSESWELSEYDQRIVIAPSFENTSLLNQFFEDICVFDFKRHENIEFIIKPHPASLKTKNIKDPFFNMDFFDRTKLELLKKTIEVFTNVKFMLDPDIDTKGLLKGRTVLVTDYSGIAFDALLLKTPVIYLLNETKVNLYFKERYQLDYNVTDRFIESGGASHGLKVNNFEEAINTASNYDDANWYYYSEYGKVIQKLLFNPGKAIDNTIKALYE